MPAKHTSSLEPVGTLIRTERGEFFAQFSIGAGARKGTLLRTCKTEEEAEQRKLAIAKLVARLRESDQTSTIPKIIREAGKLDAAGMRKLVLLVERIVAGKEPGLVATTRREGLTLNRLAELWTNGELAKQYPDHVRVKKPKQIANDRRVYELFATVRLPDGSRFGERSVASITLDDCDHVMHSLPKTARSPSTRRHYAQALRKLLVYAVYPLRLLPALPIPKGWLPKASSDKAKAWVYPSEDLALMQCTEMPRTPRLLRHARARRPPCERGARAHLGRSRPRAGSDSPR